MPRTSEWFSNLSKTAQATYLQAHPNSKFGKGGAKINTTTHGDSKTIASLQSKLKAKTKELIKVEKAAQSHRADLNKLIADRKKQTANKNRTKHQIETGKRNFEKWRTVYLRAIYSNKSTVSNIKKEIASIQKAIKAASKK